MNTIGNIFRLTSFGESHGPALGGVIDGLPAGELFSSQRINDMLARRAPGRSALTTQRREPDRVQFLSGLMGWDAEAGHAVPLTPEAETLVALGTPVGFMIPNSDQRSTDYDRLRHLYRPSHADYAWDCRYGIRDWRGGGRSSGRETISRVVAGAFAMQLLERKGVTIASRISSIGGIANPSPEQIEATVTAARADHDSVGGTVTCTVTGLPVGIGEPTFGKLQQMLAGAIMSIGAVKGFEYGMGFEGVEKRGSEVADSVVVDPDGTPTFPANHSGGIQGGISNGAPIVFRVAVKPTPTIAQPLHGLTDSGEEVEFTPHGRHDPCILLRVLPVVEAMAAITLADAWLMRHTGF